MTAPSVRLVEEGSSIRLLEEGNLTVERHNDASSAREEVQSNTDLYAPPAYTVISTSGEESLDAEAFVPEKTPLLERPQSADRNDRPSPSYAPESSGSRDERPPSRGSPQAVPARKPIDWTRDNANAIRCSVLNDRPATWTVKTKKGMALCPLAAAVLLRDGILGPKHLQLVPSLLDRPSSSSRFDPHDPTDPLSAVILSSYDVLGDALLGAAGGPIEVGRKLGPQRRESERSEALVRLSQGSTWSQENRRSTENALMVGPKAVVHYGVGTYKGCRKIVETAIKTPMIYTHSLTRGFHNTPKLYGEELRPRAEVFDLKSGLAVGGKTLVLGTYDGLKDFFVMPVKGARKEGVVGAGKGFCKGIGNFICNVGEAGCGVIGYSSYGIYKEIQKSASGGNLPARNVVLTLGEAEYEQANEEERRNVIKRWLQVQMRQMG
ncbi:hypothetical protein P171DRAFT_427302 [Karstenula rhodostoma CBS 690.94]|uniref:Uncharacterized protein n=1 Tax=Karstenula rhodostoma CBS 690.94 TaxID=1392251 RepID=A0A9P4PY93_9PLEO|nr:hypothetical protein P171DRAFT_427302 [Karstenula rhodostoma CBS 690.94]